MEAEVDQGGGPPRGSRRQADELLIDRAPRAEDFRRIKDRLSASQFIRVAVAAAAAD